jgi:hypothetical protein
MDGACYVASPTGVIPELLMYPNKKREVVDFLKALPLESKRKRQLLLGWAQTVGMRIEERLYRELDESAIDS